METRTVHLYVFDTLADWEPGFAVAGLNNPSLQARPGTFQVRTVGPSTEPVRTIGGLTIVPDLALDELDPSGSAMLILPGGELWDEGGNLEAAAKATEFLAAGVPVAAICGATAGLAAAGLLDTREHTSNAPEYLKATGYRGEALYRDRPAVMDGGVITASSMAPLEFAYEIFRTLEVYSPPVLEAWFGLFSTREPRYVQALMQAAGAGDEGAVTAGD